MEGRILSFDNLFFDRIFFPLIDLLLLVLLLLQFPPLLVLDYDLFIFTFNFDLVTIFFYCLV